MGGSTGAGITSGLSRRGYYDGKRVTCADILAEWGPAPRSSNVYDFLTEWGLNMASSPPMGNVIQTAAGTAREPHAKMVEGKGKDEMAQYMANMASTDKALAAFTDIEVAKQKANELNKDYSIKRRIEDGADKIMTNTNPGEYGSNYNEAYGISQGKVFISDLIQSKGGAVNAGIIDMTATEDGKGFSFDAGNLDPAKIWWDPDKKSWMTVSIVGDTATKNYHNSDEAAFAALGETITTGSTTGDGKKEPPPEGKTQIEGSQGIIVTIDEGDWNHGTTLSGNLIRNGKVYDKKTKRLIPNKNLNYLGNNKMHPFGYAKKDTTGSGAYIDQSGGHEGEDVFIYLDENEPSHPSKIIKEEKEKDYSELDKWWKNQTSNYGAGYQGVN